MNSGDKVIPQLLKKDPLSQVGLLQGFDSLLDKFCSTCEMWLGNPLQHLQSLISAPGRVKPISLIRPVERWSSGSQLGCILCQVVSLASASIRESRNGLQFDVIQLFVTPTRDDFPHRITLLGLDSDIVGNGKLWEVELYATVGKISAPFCMVVDHTQC